ncbi:4-diphosphocytidyl-2C-methyl-D-erythritol kinase [Sphingomonas metalli]|uniref:4-diphosphocytidyl-2C-methyl-D-erythritol kinase n=1 Tax=Sphingomonas metalli TaxID=1779358 RepID=A0A916SYK8_9SPHN|nr:nucleotidyltransferase family protein [Sphingomonas metalli]GGB20089.1 4-diphosphocytidyl-2C-methyl-D-erythritol kinase [Sphingomonas metalli]
MASVEDCVLVLLAAGRSSRFGDGNKLEAEFLGRPVGFHVVRALEDIPFRSRLVVRDGCSLDFASCGYTEIHNERQDLGMSESVKLGVAHAREMGAQSVLIALADMPRVTAAHIFRLFDAADSADAVVASSDGHEPRPPVLFGRARFDQLLSLTGDQGARALIAAGRHVVTSPAELIDIDTPEDLERIRQLVHAPERLVP